MFLLFLVLLGGEVGAVGSLVLAFLVVLRLVALGLEELAVVVWLRCVLLGVGPG
ncbi:MAG TPA: hypothetical protein VGK51_13860 [Actinomycetota bacterium]